MLAAPSPRNRVVAAIGAAAVQGLLLYALIVGLAVGLPAPIEVGLKLFGALPEAPRPPLARVLPKPATSHRRDGAASPPNLRARATEIVAPAPQLAVPVPPVAAATIAGNGTDASAGAAAVVGPGTGSGGSGDGMGGGGAGDGDGDGGGDVPPRWLRGRLKDSDFPAAAAESGAGGTVSVRYTVAVDGRVRNCVVTRSSGNTELDTVTCRLIEERFRYRPSRDPAGRPVPSVIVENHSWENYADGPPDDRRPR